MARLRAAERRILDAAVTGDASAAREGFAIHPLVGSPTVGARLLDGYREHCPEIAVFAQAGALQR